MKNSQKFKTKLIISKISHVLLTILLIYVFTKNIMMDLVPFFSKAIIIAIYTFIVGSILIILVYCLITKNRFSKEEKQKIYDELDNKIDKIFDKYGLYITENYIICMGSEINVFKLFAIPVKEIGAIDTYSDSRFFYVKKGKKIKHQFLSFINASIKTNLLYKDDHLNVFNIICDKKVYCITTSTSFNRKKMKQINEMADYICNKYPDIDYL